MIRFIQNVPQPRNPATPQHRARQSQQLSVDAESGFNEGEEP